MFKTLRGMSLMDVMIGAALFLIVFVAIAVLLRTSVMLSTVTKAKTGADAILSERMEYIRSLSYSAVGTVGGTPEGVLEANATSTENGVVYATHISVAYADDSHDGLGASDANSITGDYKIVEIDVTYDVHGVHTEKNVGTVAPPHTETSLSGGTIVVHVVNALGVAVTGATVHITNTTVTPSADISAFTNAKGFASFSGILEGTGYAVTVNEVGYSSAETYSRTAGNPNPASPDLTVTEGQTTVATFAIDQQAVLTLQTRSMDSTPLGNVSLVLTGSKTIGTSATGAPVYTTESHVTTDLAGTAVVALPWDIYQVVPSGYSVASSSVLLPLQLLPGDTTMAVLTLTP